MSVISQCFFILKSVQNEVIEGSYVGLINVLYNGLINTFTYLYSDILVII